MGGLKVKNKIKKGADQKEEIAWRKEKRRLDMLDKLKFYGGPVTDSREVPFSGGY